MTTQKMIDKSVEKVSNQIRIKTKTTKPFLNFFIKHNISPNMITAIGLACSILSAIFLTLGFLRNFWFWSFPIILLAFSGVFDMVDGEVARRTNRSSDAGAFLDSNVDRMSDAIIILGIVYAGLIEFIIGYIVIFLMVMISYSRSRAETLGVSMRGVGMMERVDRFFYLIFLLTGEFIMFYFLGISIIFAGMLVFIALLTITFIQRIVFGYKMLNSNGD